MFDFSSIFLVLDIHLQLQCLGEVLANSMKKIFLIKRQTIGEIQHFSCSVIWLAVNAAWQLKASGNHHPMAAELLGH